MLFASIPIESALIEPDSTTSPLMPPFKFTVVASMLPPVIWTATGPPMTADPTVDIAVAVTMALLIATGAELRMVRLPSLASMALAMIVPPALMPVADRPGPINAVMLMLRALRVPTLLMPVPAMPLAAVVTNARLGMPADDTPVTAVTAPAATRSMLPSGAAM